MDLSSVLLNAATSDKEVKRPKYKYVKIGERPCITKGGFKGSMPIYKAELQIYNKYAK